MTDDETAYRGTGPEDWPESGGESAGGVALAIYFLFIPTLTLAAWWLA